MAALPTGQANAQDPTPEIPDDQVNAIAKEMYCPVCENVPLDVCPTQACHQWRELIREKLAEGWTEKEIKAYFVQQYGDRVLAEPPREGLNWLVYVIPPLAIPIGIYLVYRVLRSWQSTTPEVVMPSGKPPEASAEPQDEYQRKLEEQLRNRD